MPQGVANNNNKNNTQTKYRWTIQMWVYQYFVTSLVAPRVKESACKAGGTDLIPWSGRSPGEGIDYPIQYSFLGFLGELDSKESTCNVGYLGSIPGLERSPRGGHATHSSFLTWRIQWREESGRLQSTGLQRVGHDSVTKHTHTDVKRDVQHKWLIRINRKKSDTKEYILCNSVDVQFQSQVKRVCGIKN